MFKKTAALLSAFIALECVFAGGFSVTAKEYDITVSSGGIAAYDTAVSDSGIVAYDDTLSPSGILFANTPENTAAVKWQTKIDKGINSGYPTCVSDGKYLYTAAVNKIYKIDKETGDIVKTSGLKSRIAHTYYMTLADGKLFIQLENGSIQAFAADGLTPLWISGAPDGSESVQGISPVIYDGGSIYASTVAMSKRYGRGSYYCINASDGSFVWQFDAQENSASSSGFYRAGAAVEGNKLIFGSEGGTLYMLDKYSGSLVDKTDIDGDIRTGCVVYDGEVFFTTKNGRLYAVGLTQNGFGNARYTEFCKNSTCKPVIAGGRIYVGGSTGGYANGVFCVFDSRDLSEKARFTVPGNVQSEPLAVRKTNGICVYFTCNDKPGRLMCLSDVGGECTVAEIFAPSGEYAQYCINGVTADENGILYYQNDSGCLAALEKSAEATETTTESSSHSGGGSGVSENIHINVEITGDTVHGDEPHKAYDKWAQAEYTLKKGVTAEDVITKALKENGFEPVVEDGYISSVTMPDGTELAEFANGEKSGWMYKVNGEFPQVSMRDYRLEDGDSVELVYSDDYTVTDKSSRTFSGGGVERTTETSTEMTSAEQSTEKPQETEESPVFFKDTEEGVWYFYPVECLHFAGILNGRGDGMFCPDDIVTRAEFITVLYRIYGSKSGFEADFADVAEGAWYFDAVGWAQKDGVVCGDGSRFMPDMPIEKQDMAVILYRLCEESVVGGIDIADRADISPYALKAAEFALQSGIMDLSEGRFYPHEYPTRADMAVIVFEFAEKKLM